MRLLPRLLLRQVLRLQLHLWQGLLKLNKGCECTMLVWCLLWTCQRLQSLSWRIDSLQPLPGHLSRLRDKALFCAWACGNVGMLVMVRAGHWIHFEHTTRPGMRAFTFFCARQVAAGQGIHPKVPWLPVVSEHDCDVVMVVEEIQTSNMDTVADAGVFVGTPSLTILHRLCAAKLRAHERFKAELDLASLSETGSRCSIGLVARSSATL